VALTLGGAFPSSAQAGTPVKIAFAAGSISFADLFIAQQQGFFAAEGLKVELVATLNGSLAHNSLVSGAVDFAPLSGGYVPFVRPAGIRTRQVAARTELNGFSLLVRQELAGTVQSVADLRGRRIAVEALGSSITWAMAVNYLARAGLDFNKDVKLLALGSRAAAQAALSAGQADAAVRDGPADVQLVAAGAAFRLIDPLKPSQHLLWVGNSHEDALAWLTREQVIAERPQVVQALVKAADKALGFLRDQSKQGKLDQVAAELSSFYEGFDASLLAQSLERFARTLAPQSSLSEFAYWADLVKWVSLGLVQPLSFTDAVDSRFAGTRP